MNILDYFTHNPLSGAFKLGTRCMVNGARRLMQKTNTVYRIVHRVPSTVHLILGICMFASCTKNNEFAIEGNVKDGSGKTLYLENVTTSAVMVLDSVELGDNGSFRFKRSRPQAPDFYRLRLKNQFVNLSVDSTETINVQSDTLNFARNYTVEGSSECTKIKELTFLQLATHEAYNKFQKQYDSKEISLDEYVAKVKEIIDAYKVKATNYIIANPASASAYFALFQQINGLLIFDPYDKRDSRMYGAVANNWNLNYPDALRTVHLVNLFKNSLFVLRKEQNALKPNEMDSKQFFDISLPSIQDNEIRLSEAGAGKVMLLDFTAYESQDSPQHNMDLQKIYWKYESQGFTIYQVSLDRDKHFWKNAAVNLPWICVNDPQSIYSEIAKKYNVSNLPTGFLFGKDGEIVSRIDNYGDLEKLVVSGLK
ncbi:MAG: AhpC/TSA family protein [Dysgonamonadaceae bacterium]|jgi:thioredoxin-related protein|nr:AhpC/TSA family protein [Dysgonamonadaceae bacterium]